MNVDNFVVRPNRRLVEQSANADPWSVPDEASGPSWRMGWRGSLRAITRRRGAKRFDLPILKLQLAVPARRAFAPAGKQSGSDHRRPARGQPNIPMIQPRTSRCSKRFSRDEWWEDVTTPCWRTYASGSATW